MTEYYHGATPADELNDALFIACRRGDLTAVQDLLQRGANVFAQDNGDRTPFFYACPGGNIDVLRCLVAQGAFPLHEDEDDNNALLSAVGNDNPALLAYLLDLGLDINNEYGTSGSPLMRACEEGAEHAFAYLLAQGVDLNIESYATALEQAVRYGRLSMVQRLLEAGADPTVGEPLKAALTADSFREDIAELLLQAGCPPTLVQHTTGDAPKTTEARAWMQRRNISEEIIDHSDTWEEERSNRLLRAAETNDTELSRLLAAGEDINYGQGTWHGSPLRRAVETGNLSAARRLLQAGASVAARFVWDSPLMPQYQRVDDEMLKLLLQHGADPNICDGSGYSIIFRYADADDEAAALTLLHHGVNLCQRRTDLNEDLRDTTPFLYFCRRSTPRVCAAMLAAGASLQERDTKGNTPLLYACNAGHFTTYGSNAATAAWLLEQGVKVNEANDDGLTPLMTANARVSRLLLAAGADAAPTSRYGHTALLQACRLGDEELIRHALVSGAEVNAVCSYSYTRRHVLTEAPLRPHLFRLLLDAGASPDISNGLGITPLHRVCKMKNHDHVCTLANLLLTRGANPAAKDYLNNTPLTYAEQQGNERLLNMLQERTDFNG